MTFSRTKSATAVAAVFISGLLATSLTAPDPAVALGEAQEAPGPSEAEAEASPPLVAPFLCGTEWRGSTYGGHGANNWNLDLNSTSRTYADREFDHGAPILAQGDGTVVWFKASGYNNRAGTYVEIDYGDITVRYVHLVENSIPAEVARIGAKVETGQVIGLLGDTGRASHAHLHLEMWDSSDHPDTAWYQLPRQNQIPAQMEGQVLVATPSVDTHVFTSTNCEGDAYPYADVLSTSPAKVDIALLNRVGILDDGTGEFRPRAELTRAEAATAVAALWRRVDAGATVLPGDLEAPFDDVDTESGGLAADVALLNRLAIMRGTDTAEFSPGATITGAELATVLRRTWERLAGPDALLFADFGLTAADADLPLTREAAATRFAELHRRF